MKQIEAPAKINLGLQILRKRADGFHDLESVFLKVGWFDSLEARSSDVLQMTCSDPTLPTDERNLVMSAARLLQKESGVTAGASLHLEKRIPQEAGLGGGSSDAAHALLLLCELWSIDPVHTRLTTLGATVGSDVPFFFGESASFVQGRGEVIHAIPDYHFPFALAIVKPAVSISTREAFGNINPSPEDRTDIKRLVVSNDPERWRAELVNDFENSVFPNHPELKVLKSEMYGAGAVYAAMSGSGSAIYGVFDSAQDAIEAEVRLKRADRITWSGKPA